MLSQHGAHPDELLAREARGLVDEVLRLIATVEARNRQRGANAKAAFRQAVERFVGDLLIPLAKAQHNEHGNSVDE